MISAIIAHEACLQCKIGINRDINELSHWILMSLSLFEIRSNLNEILFENFICQTFNFSM